MVWWFGGGDCDVLVWWFGFCVEIVWLWFGFGWVCWFAGSVLGMSFRLRVSDHTLVLFGVGVSCLVWLVVLWLAGWGVWLIGLLVVGWVACLCGAGLGCVGYYNIAL